MKKRLKWHIVFIVTCIIGFLLLCQMRNVYGDEPKKSDEAKKPPTTAESPEKDKNIDAGNGKGGQQKSVEREKPRKKVPAFWFLLPEK